MATTKPVSSPRFGVQVLMPSVGRVNIRSKVLSLAQIGQVIAQLPKASKPANKQTIRQANFQFSSSNSLFSSSLLSSPPLVLSTYTATSNLRVSLSSFPSPSFFPPENKSSPYLQQISSIPTALPQAPPCFAALTPVFPKILCTRLI